MRDFFRTFAPDMKAPAILLPLLLLAAIPLHGQDSLAASPVELRLRPQQVIVPAAMVTAGAIAISNPRLSGWKHDVRDAFQRGRNGRHKANVETWATLTMQATTMALGPAPRHSLLDRLLVKTTSYALLYSLGPVVRRCVREARPDGHGPHAFPSLKTAAAFMAAEQTRIERGWGWGMGFYAFAAGVGVLQMYNDRCYLNDVLAGAGMGILCTHAAYWLLPLERRWFGLDKRRKAQDSALLLLPTYDPSTHTAGLSFACTL